ncbi:MAG TPA: GEVED domain-containing protein [Chitinophagales bacterium]|nr:GEVED domain-containing protein [Chitinophagales bacterium]
MIRQLAITLLAGAVIYTASAQPCIPTYTAGTTDNDYIESFECNTISNPGSGPGDGSGYTDFTDLSTDLVINETYEIFVENTPYFGENYRIWIDYNHDNIFSSTEEIVTLFSLAAGGSTTLSFTVAMTASPGETTMRIRCVYGTTDFDACSGETYGETEDYAVNIIGLANDVGVSIVNDITDDCDLSSDETVSIIVTNYGTEPASGFSVSYFVDGGTVNTEMFPGGILPGASSPFTFSAGADLSSDGTHVITAWTNYADDMFNGNDSSDVSINNLFTYLTTGFPENICYDGGTIFPSPLAGGGTWSGEAIIDPLTGEMDPTLVGGIGGSTDVTYSFTTTGSYTVTQIPYAPAVPAFETTLGLGDDATANDINIGFPFTYFGNTYTKLFISSNGLIGFSAPSTSYTQQHFPNAADPDNIIAFCWTDLNPSAGGSISYETIGVAPNRKFIVYYDDVVHYLGTATVTGQIVLHETSNAIDIIAVNIESDGGNMTQGIENTNGTEAYNAGEAYNNAVWTMSEMSWRYAVTPCDGEVTETINFVTPPVVELPDSAVCQGSSVTLDAGTGAEYYVWSTGENTQSITVDETDDYWVTYYANEFCFVTDSASIIVNSNPPVDLGPDGTKCEGTMLDAENPGADYLWNTGATTQTLFVTEPGTYSVYVENPITGCYNSDTITMSIIPLPIADYSAVATDLTVVFTSLAGDVDTWFWDFGDGSTSIEENPWHIYPFAGDYTVTFVVTNGCGADLISEVFSITTGINALSQNALSIYPNPASTTIHVSGLPNGQEQHFRIMNMTGSVVLEGKSMHDIDISALPASTYVLLVDDGSGQFKGTFVKD